jgi:hypothetical protein
MEDNEQTGEIGPIAAGSTEGYPTLTYPAIVGGELDEPLDDSDDEWADRGPARGIRLAVPTAALVALLLVGGGFWAGAALQKSHGSSSSSGAGSAASFLSRLRSTAGASGATGTGQTGTTGAGAGATGAGGFGLGSSAAATGTISVVDGKVLYVLTTSGALVKVTLGPSTSITRNAKSTPIDLRPGDTVVIQGATATNGNVSAASVAATAPGVSSAGGFGGGGRFGGSGGSGSTTSTTSG